MSIPEVGINMEPSPTYLMLLHVAYRVQLHPALESNHNFTGKKALLHQR